MKEAPEDESFIDQWPQPLHPNKLPTPYQILNHKRGTSYSKARFYELVKLYHPDRSDHHSHASLCRTIPIHIRLERYRLIVAAHTILSDPYKQTAYDVHGAGWAGTPEAIRAQYPKHGPDSPMNNATWEDWERWYERFSPDGRGKNYKRGRQKPVFLSNTTFVSLIAFLAALGGIGQATRVDSNTKSILLLREELHEKNSKEFRRVRDEARGLSREERIAHFLRVKDPAAYAHDGLRKVMLEMDVCGPGQGKAGGAPNRDADFRRPYQSTGQGRHPLQRQVDATSSA